MKALALLAVLIVPAASTQLLSNSARQEASGAHAAVPDSWLARVSQDIRGEEYRYSPLGIGAFSAPNRAQELRLRVSTNGIEVFPRSVSADGERAPWRLELRTKSF